MSIPKIIHQVWEGRTEPSMPARLQILARTWKEKNPDWEYHLWNGEEMDKLVETHFPEYLSLYKSFPYNVQRWDTIRYMILHVYGGVYTDLDSECYQPIDSLLENQRMCFGEEPQAHNYYLDINRLIGNAFMASEAGCKGWLKVLEAINEAMKQEQPNDSRVVVSTTGPVLISRIFSELEKNYSATVLPSEYIAPLTTFEMRRYIYAKGQEVFEQKIKDAYCAHYFIGTWLLQFSKEE